MPTIIITMPQNAVDQLLASNQYVAFALESDTPPISAMVWGTAAPNLFSNVQWEDGPDDHEYGVYAANGSVINGAFVEKIAQQSRVTRGSICVYGGSGQFGKPLRGGPLNGITILNQDQQTNLAFGMTQHVSINSILHESIPVFAANLLTQHGLTFPFSSKVSFFMTPQLKVGQIIEQIPAPGITVDTRLKRVINLSFNGKQWSQN